MGEVYQLWRPNAFKALFCLETIQYLSCAEKDLLVDPHTIIPDESERNIKFSKQNLANIY